jgi:hypothetical protein
VIIARGRLPIPTVREALYLLAVAATGLVFFNVFVIAGVREADPATVGVIIGCVLATVHGVIDGPREGPGVPRQGSAIQFNPTARMVMTVR